MPLIFIAGFSYLQQKQFTQLPLQNSMLYVPESENSIFQLKNGWRYYDEDTVKMKTIELTPFTLATDKTTVFTTKLHVPNAEEIYSLSLQGIHHPFELWVNDKLIKDYDFMPPNKLINFYVEESDVELKLVITPTTNRIAILQTPLFGQADLMQDFFIRNVLIMLITLVSLTILGIYSIVLYFSKRHQVFHLHIGSYFLLIGASIFLSSKGISTILLPFSPSVLLKLKAISGLLAAIPLFLVIFSFKKQSNSKRNLYIFLMLMALLLVLIPMLPFDLYRLLEFTIWMSLIILLFITFIQLTVYLIKNKQYDLRNLVLCNALLYLFIYLVLRIYYNIWGTDLQTDYWLITFAIFICLYLTLYQNHLVDELEKSKRVAIESRISFFNAQIKPHFIYNALSNIIALCYTDNRRAATLLGKFSTFLRLIFENNKPNEWITLEKELTLIDAYVEIEKARFPNKITYTLKVEDRLKALKIPPLSIQPFVENAIRHGLFNKVEPGNVSLTIEQQQNELVISIADDGIGMSSKTIAHILDGTKEHQGIGILNVVQRLKYIDGSYFHIQSNENEGTRITMKLPLQH